MRSIYDRGVMQSILVVNRDAVILVKVIVGYILIEGQRRIGDREKINIFFYL